MIYLASTIIVAWFSLKVLGHIVYEITKIIDHNQTYNRINEQLKTKMRTENKTEEIAKVLKQGADRLNKKDGDK